MVPLADLHVHLLAGLDDGPKTDEEALEMCRIAYAEGIRMAAATAHQNDHWKEVTPDRIRAAARHLAEGLRARNIAVDVYPNAEVMVHIDMVESWRGGKLLSVADRGEYLLIEMPHALFVDLRRSVPDLVAAGVRPILAHPERCLELLYDTDHLAQLIRAGCLVQVSTSSITRPSCGRDERALRGWFKRGMVHLLGTDGHSPRRRSPRMAEAYDKIVRWVGPSAAHRIGSLNGMAVLHGLPLRVPAPEPERKWWSFLPRGILSGRRG